MGLEGVQLGHYRVRSLIARGGMGEIYLADDTNLPRQVAIKVVQSEPTLYPNETATQEANRLFEREMRLISSLDHPYILQLLDYGTETVQGKPTTYMVMPYRAEGSLIDWLRNRGNREPLPPQDVAHFVREAADALQHAHDRNILHMDVKPSNFLIRNRQETPTKPDLLLMDFGISKAIDATKASTTSRGTLAYMASEQWNGHPVPASDQYALAIMAYEMLTGQLPFRGNDMQMMYQHMQTAPVPPSSLNTRLPRAIDTVILRALAKNPQDRYPSIRAFADAFQQAAVASNNAPTPPPPPPPHANAGAWAPTYPMPNQNQNVNPNPNPWSLPGQAPAPPQVPPLPPQPPQPQRPNMMGRIVLIALAVLIVLGGVIYLFSKANPQPPTVDRNATATALAANNSGPTATPAPTDTPAPTATPTSATKLTFNDPLTSNTNNWEENSNCAFTNNSYHVTGSQNNTLFSCLATSTNFSVFAYQVDLTVISGDGGGVVFCVNNANNSYYYFGIRPTGQYELYKYNNHQATTLIQPTASSLVRTGTNQQNTIAVGDGGGQIVLYINNSKITSVQDGEFSQGKIGVAAIDLTNATDVSFSNAKVIQNA